MKPIMQFDPSDILLANRIKALAHPARLAILRALMRPERSGVCYCGDIVRDLPLAQSTVSQHLKVLREAGLIQGEIDGPRSCYCLNRETLSALTEALDRFGGSLAAHQPLGRAGG
jgi:ArsR family transcriptional regulator